MCYLGFKEHIAAIPSMFHFAIWEKEKNTESDDFIIQFLKPGLSGWYKLESGDAIFNSSDVVGYEMLHVNQLVLL